MHSIAIATVLECHPTTQTWESCVIDLLAPNVTLPETCYIFLEAGSWYKKHCSEADRKKLLAPFEAPDFLSTKTCTDLNGYFGSRTSFAPEGSDGTRVRSLSTWFRILTKKVLKPEEGRTDEGKDYLWNEMGFFTRWSNSYTCRVLCIDTPLELRLDLTALLTAQLPSSFEPRDPFAMVRPLLDQVIKLCDENTWRATKSVRGVELTRGQRPDFQRLRDLARHTGHIVEAEQVAVETIEQIASRQESIFRELADILPETYRTQANEYLAFQLQAMKNLQWRSQSTHERLAEEITLAFNMLASSDNVIMKSITLLTMIFLPATFISALFSTTFFSFEENGWRFSNKFWIYWVVTIPFTIAVVLVWWGWMDGSNTTIRSRWLSDPKGKRAQTA